MRHKYGIYTMNNGDDMISKKLAVIGTLIIGCAAGAMFVLQAHAASLFITTTYYSDSSHASVVGERTRDCAGMTASWGSTSNDYTRTTEMCPLR
jgi:hypothetical protein